MAEQSGFCKSCGAPKRAGATFCNQCGAVYSGEPSRGKVTPGYDGVVMEARGVNGRIQLLDDRVRILRKGLLSLATQGIKGDKEIR